MNLGHRVRIAEYEELRRENAKLREILLEVAPEEIDLDAIDLREDADDGSGPRVVDQEAAVGPSR